MWRTRAKQSLCITNYLWRHNVIIRRFTDLSMTYIDVSDINIGFSSDYLLVIRMLVLIQYQCWETGFCFSWKISKKKPTNPIHLGDCRLSAEASGTSVFFPILLFMSRNALFMFFLKHHQRYGNVISVIKRKLLPDKDNLSSVERSRAASIRRKERCTGDWKNAHPQCPAIPRVVVYIELCIKWFHHICDHRNSYFSLALHKI